MRKSLRLLTFALTASTLVPLVGCKTTEANYKSAYESAAARRAEQTSGDDTASAPIAGADGVVREFLSPAPLADGSTPAPLAGYYVAVNRFRQIFNAKALCRRLIDGGHADAVIARTATDHYYVLLPVGTDLPTARTTMQALPADLPYGQSCPFLIHPIR